MPFRSSWDQQQTSTPFHDASSASTVPPPSLSFTLLPLLLIGFLCFALISSIFCIDFRSISTLLIRGS